MEEHHQSQQGHRAFTPGLGEVTNEESGYRRDMPAETQRMGSLNPMERTICRKEDEMSSNNEERLLRLPEVIDRVGLSKPALYARIAEGTFPKPVKIGRRAVAWPRSAVDEWIQRAIEASR